MRERAARSSKRRRASARSRSPAATAASIASPSTRQIAGSRKSTPVELGSASERCRSAASASPAASSARPRLRSQITATIGSLGRRPAARARPRAARRTRRRTRATGRSASATRRAGANASPIRSARSAAVAQLARPGLDDTRLSRMLASETRRPRRAPAAPPPRAAPCAVEVVDVAKPLAELEHDPRVDRAGGAGSSSSRARSAASASKPSPRNRSARTLAPSASRRVPGSAPGGRLEQLERGPRRRCGLRQVDRAGVHRDRDVARPRTSGSLRRRQRLLGQHDRGRFPLPPVVDLGQRQQRSGRRRSPGGRSRLQLVEHGRRALEVARVVEVLGQVEPQLVGRRTRPRGRAASASSVSSAAVSGAPRAARAARCVRDLLAPPASSRPSLAESEVAGASPRGRSPPPRGARCVSRRRLQRRRGVHGRGEERMDELDAPVGDDPDEPGLFGRGEGSARRPVRSRAGPARRPAGARSRASRAGSGPGRRRAPGGSREPAAVASPVVPAVEEPGDLERVQRVAARGLCDPDERRRAETSGPGSSARTRCSAATESGPSSSRCNRSLGRCARAALPAPSATETIVRTGSSASRRTANRPPPRRADRASGRRRPPRRSPGREPARAAARAARFRPAVAPAAGRPRRAAARRRAHGAAGPGSAANRAGATAASRSVSPANESLASDSAGRARRTRPLAPAPGEPPPPRPSSCRSLARRRSQACGATVGLGRNVWTTATSDSRPTTGAMWRGYAAPAGPARPRSTGRTVGRPPTTRVDLTARPALGGLPHVSRFASSCWFPGLGGV